MFRRRMRGRQKRPGADDHADTVRTSEEAVAMGSTHPRRRVSVPSHWRLLTFCFVVVSVAMLFEGIATHRVGPSATAAPHEKTDGPAPLANSRPILAARGSHLVSKQPPPGRRIALTFDDGPDPHWTPKIAAILRRERVRATFFVIGSQAARHPDLVRRLVRDGNELGNHTFTHAAVTN